MSKSIRSYPKQERQSVVRRRIKGNTNGLGFWAAMDYLYLLEKGKLKDAKDK